jgi:hypothetical protein
MRYLRIVGFAWLVGWLVVWLAGFSFLGFFVSFF